MDCIFCKIASGDVSSRKLFESDDVLAFLDAFPLARGHCLVIPKRHYEKIQDMPPGVSAAVFGVVHRLIAKVDSLTGATLVAVHNGRESGQEVPHVHVHLVPRASGDGAGAIHSMFKDAAPLDGDGDGDERTGMLQRQLSL